jgi:D-beta-D-heptose 7-phosphate kinase/D-beta-D-heptose 1-phosphate adenosyltransferase
MNPPLLAPDRFRHLAKHFPDRAVLVVGDVMIDEYVVGDAARISPEAPVPVVEVQEESFRVGGAANVARNLATLGGKVELLALVGKDDRADRLRAALAQQGIDPAGLVPDAARPTTLKTRIIAGRQQIVRVDRESRDAMQGELRERFMTRVRSDGARRRRARLRLRQRAWWTWS